ncbi:hypothetical protein Avbf_06442 [Armadillidium vulgare]|nr:hypothetical protein Avbf_06442 [Armadillidium vulgare]
MQDSSEEGKPNSIRKELPTTPSCIPKILSNIDDSTHHNSLNLKDKTSSTKNKRREKKNRKKDQDIRASVLAEGQRGEVERSEAAAISSEPRLKESGWTKTSSLATASKALCKHNAMERADISPSYTSDEWEDDSVNSDTDDDHTDSSDDDDPKSQVDRLIERGTLMYMDGENSALSSEDESDDSDDDYDSESDITDVSPLVSATASPLGLSPVLPRRTVPTSPLALHDNRELSLDYNDPNHSPFDWDNPSPPFENNASDDTNGEESNNENHHLDSTRMDLLLQAVLELENQNRLQNYNLNNQNNSSNHLSGLPNNHASDPVFIHPIRDNPNHIHLNSKNFNQRRKNMSFSNEELIREPNRVSIAQINLLQLGPAQDPLNSASTRKKEDRIRRENLLLLKKIQEVKPSKELVSPVKNIDQRISNCTLKTTSSSCGTFTRTLGHPPHVSTPPIRKETVS